MREKPVTRYFLIHLAWFIVKSLGYLINPLIMKNREEDLKKEIWILENF